jgi:hypothetical protein
LISGFGGFGGLISGFGGFGGLIGGFGGFGGFCFGKPCPPENGEHGYDENC